MGVLKVLILIPRIIRMNNIISDNCGLYLYWMFRTKVIPKISPNKIELKDSILAFGSCFVQNIGQKLKDNKFNIDINPFGTLFNPLSVFNLVNLAAQNKNIDQNRIAKIQGIFHHYDLHSDLSKLNKEELLDSANLQLRYIESQLPGTSVIMYTFGTSIVYELNETRDIVANCHKVPSKMFNRRFLDIEEIVHGFRMNYDLVKGLNRNIRFILTVSPVRHQKESFEQNNLSKSILRVACDKIVQQHQNVEYFPAFEIMMDELRDYRFYKKDMLHPNSLAVDYIWQKFQDTYFSDKQKQFVLKWNKVQKAIAHKPFNVGSEQHQLFIHKTISILNKFKNDIDINPELKRLKSQLL